MNRHLDGAGPVVGGDAGGHTVFGARVHAHGEGVLVAVSVAIHHQGQLERIEALPFHRQADQAARFGGHEVDLFRCGELGRADQIAFIFTVFVIHHHHHFAVANGCQGIGHRIKPDRRFYSSAAFQLRRRR